MEPGGAPLIWYFGLVVLAAVALFALAGWLLGLVGPERERLLIDDRIVPGRLARQHIGVGRLDRRYLLYVPPGYAPSIPLPLVVMLHGGGGSSASVARSSLMHELAARENFIVVYPQGTGPAHRPGRTWNAGGRPPHGWAERAKVDDVAFVRALVDKLRHQFAIDPNRIYVAGISKGGMLAYHLACNLSEIFAATAAVAATMTTPRCSAEHPVAILHIHGTKDENVPMEGGAGERTGGGAVWPSVGDGLARWRGINGCQKTPVVVYQRGEVTCRRYPARRSGADVELCVIEGGGHGWPGSRPRLRHRATGEYIIQSFSASEHIWAYFKDHPRDVAAIKSSVLVEQ